MEHSEAETKVSDESPKPALSRQDGEFPATREARLRGTYEDMDIFYYKQISSRIQDYDLQKKIEHELKMCDGATKLLAAVRHSGLSMEAAKTLLTCNVRMAAYAEALRQKKSAVAKCLRGSCSALRCSGGEAPCCDNSCRDGGSGEIGTRGGGKTDLDAEKSSNCFAGNSYACRARVALYDIRVPLQWKESDISKSKLYGRKFALFIVARIGTEVYETNLISDIDRSTANVSFGEYFVFNDVSHDFVCTVDLYAHELYEDSTATSGSVKLRKKINGISNTVGRRLSGLVEMNEQVVAAGSTYKKHNSSLGHRVSGLGETESFESSSKRSAGDDTFELIAQAKLSLLDCRDSTDFHGFSYSNEYGVGQLLSGIIWCRIVAQPYGLIRPTVAGYLLLQDQESWRRRWCVLQKSYISCWSTSFESDMQHPAAHEIPLTKDFIIIGAAPIAEKGSLTIYVQSLKENSCKYCLEAENIKDLSMWWDGFHQNFLDQAVWGRAYENFVQISTPDLDRRYPSTSRARAYSLYDKSLMKGAQRTSTVSTGASRSHQSLLMNRLAAADSRSAWLTTRQGSFSKMSL